MGCNRLVTERELNHISAEALAAIEGELASGRLDYFTQLRLASTAAEIRAELRALKEEAVRTAYEQLSQALAAGDRPAAEQAWGQMQQARYQAEAAQLQAMQPAFQSLAAQYAHETQAAWAACGYAGPAPPPVPVAPPPPPPWNDPGTWTAGGSGGSSAWWAAPPPPPEPPPVTRPQLLLEHIPTPPDRLPVPVQTLTAEPTAPAAAQPLTPSPTGQTTSPPPMTPSAEPATSARQVVQYQTDFDLARGSVPFAPPTREAFEQNAFYCLTDHRNRPLMVEGWLGVAPDSTRTSQENAIRDAVAGPYTMYDAAHLMGHQFDPPVIPANFVPFPESINRGMMARLENYYADRVRGGEQLFAQYYAHYADTGNVPDRVTVRVLDASGNPVDQFTYDHDGEVFNA